MIKDNIWDFARSVFWKADKEGMIEVLERAALRHEEGGVYRFPLHTIYVQDAGIRIVPRDFSDEIFLFWDALLSIRFTPSQGKGAPGTLTFRMFYGSLTIVLEGNRYDG